MNRKPSYRHMVVTAMPKSILLLLIERKMLTEFLDDCVKYTALSPFYHMLSNPTFFNEKMPGYWIISLIYGEDFYKYKELYLYVIEHINKL